MGTNDAANEASAERLLFLYAETPLHVGAGSGTGFVDLPLQRERMSGLPVVPGSGLKGALREVFEPGSDDDLELFGPLPPGVQRDTAESGDDEDTEGKTGADDGQHNRQDNKDRTGRRDRRSATWAGALALTDARLLLFPMRSAKGGWAWVTSPMILQRLARDLHRIGAPASALDLPDKMIAALHREDTVFVSTTCTLLLDGDLVLEDLRYDRVHSGGVGKWVDALAELLAKALPQGDDYKPFRGRIEGQLVVVSDTDLTTYARQYTEVVTRIRMDPETGAVSKGGLWTEEHLPAEALLYAVVTSTVSRRPSEQREPKANPQPPRTASELIAVLDTKLSSRPRLRLGGNRNVGRGLVATHLVAAGGLQ